MPIHDKGGFPEYSTVLLACFGLAAMLFVATPGIAAAESSIFGAIELKEGDLPDYRLRYDDVSDSGWWVVLGFAPDQDETSSFLKNYVPKERYPRLSQRWYRQADPGSPVGTGYDLAIGYGIFDSPSQALCALRAHQYGISNVSSPTKVAIGDYSLKTINSVSFTRNNVLISVAFDRTMRIDSPGFKSLSAMIIARIDADPPPVTVTTRSLIYNLHILEFMGYIDKNSGIVNSLQDKVEAAHGALARADKAEASNALNAFIGVLNSLIGGVAVRTEKAIEPAAARALIAEANALIGSIQRN